MQVEGSPQPSSQCQFGFSGSRCQYPTFYLAFLGALVLSSLAVAAIAILYKLWKKKRRGEEALRSHVQQFNSVWQVRYDEVTINDRIGQGGYGEVFRAQYRDMTVAMKILRFPADESIPDGLDREIRDFEREIKFMQTIRHPNIVMFLGAGRLERSGAPFIIAEFMQRGSVRNLLDDQTKDIDYERKLKIALDVAEGMNFLHNLSPPRIHCDLKSDNLLISQSWIVKVADFGQGRQLISRRNLSTKKNRSSQRHLQSEAMSIPLIQSGDEWSQLAVGAARWRAPEVSRHDLQQLSTSADVYR